MSDNEFFPQNITKTFNLVRVISQVWGNATMMLTFKRQHEWMCEWLRQHVQYSMFNVFTRFAIFVPSIHIIIWYFFCLAFLCVFAYFAGSNGSFWIWSLVAIAAFDFWHWMIRWMTLRPCAHYSFYCCFCFYFGKPITIVKSHNSRINRCNFYKKRRRHWLPWKYNKQVCH